MICTDERVTKICSEIFHFLKSSENSKDIHRKTINKRSYKTGSCGTSIDIGFLSITMVWKPLTMVNGEKSGSDEGANVFIYLPFAASPSMGAAKFQVTGYYSEKSSRSMLTIVTEDIYKSSPIGTQRVVREVKEVDTSSPF